MDFKTVFLALSLCFVKSQNDLFIAYQYSDRVCATNTSFALSWISERLDDRLEQVSSVVPKTEPDSFECDIRNDSKTVSFFAKTPWVLKKSTQWTNGQVVLDWRWETMKVTRTATSYEYEEERYQPVVSTLTSNFDLTFSVRTKYEAHVFLCDGDYPPSSNCYWLMLQAFSGNRTAMRKCGKSSIPKLVNQYPPQPCRNLLAKTEHPNFPSYLSAKKWTHLRIKKTKKSLSLHLVEYDKEAVILEFKDFVDDIDVTHMIVNSKKVNAIWKIHNIEFIYTNEKSYKVQLGPDIFIHDNSEENSLCVSMLVSMCKTCRLKLALTNNGDTIGEKTYTTQSVKWREIKFFSDSLPKNLYKFKLLVSTIGDDQNRFWALDNFRLCQKKEFRTITLGEHTACQLMSSDNNVAVVKRATENLGSNCSEDTIGPFCMPCTLVFGTYCRNAEICTKEKCFCSAGFDSRTACFSQCEEGTYGHGCQKKCGKCRFSCDSVDGKCVYQKCRDNFTGPKCDIPPQLQKPPKILNVTYTKATIECTIETLERYSSPRTYSLQYKKSEDKTWKNIGQNYKSDENCITAIDNLEPDTSYFVRSVITSDNITYDGDNVKTSNFTTKCEEIIESNVVVTATNTTATIFIKQPTPKLCKLSKYFVYVDKVESPLQQNKDSIEVTKLSPFTNYVVIFKRGAQKFAKKFQTNEGVPTNVQNLEVTNVTSSTVTIKWKPPKMVNGLLEYYIVEYQHMAYTACNSSSPKPKTRINAKETTLTINNLIPYSNYSFSINAANRNYEGLPYQFFQNTPSSNITDFADLSNGAHCISDTHSVTFKLDVSCDKLRSPLNVTVAIKCTNVWCLNQKDRKVHQRYPFTLAIFKNLTSYSDHEISYNFCRESSCSSAFFKKILKTKPTAPDRVTELLVYTKNQTSVSLRWKPPYPPTGILTQYSIEYNNSDHFFNKKSCKLWPNLHCATLTNLEKNSSYEFKVSSRNQEPPDFGDFESIIAVTKIEKSQAPYDLQISWSIFNDLELKWKHPNMTNGDIKLFKISILELNVEEQFPVNESVYALTYKYKIDGSKIHPSTVCTVNIWAYNGYDGEKATVTDTSPPDIPLLKSGPKVMTTDNSILVEVNSEIVNRSEINIYGLFLLIDDSELSLDKELEMCDTEFKLCLSQRIIYEVKNFDQNVSKTIGGSDHVGNFSLVSGTNYKIGVVITNTLGKTSYKVYYVDATIRKYNYNLLALLLLLLIIPLVIIVIKYKRKRGAKEEQLVEYDYPLTHFLKPEQSHYENTSETPFSKKIPLFQLEDYLKKAEVSGEFDVQHDMVVNLRSSVTYMEIRDTEYFDYVDIEFCDFSRLSKVYIVAGLPKNESINEFWKTVWDENILHMVLLASPQEQASYKYYPQENEKMECCSISVQLAFSKHIDNYEQTTFILINNEQIRHVDLIEFPYQGLNPLPFVPLLRKMSTFPLDPSSPIFVHSNDLERAGFVLLCDMSLRMAEKEGKVDVWKNLKQLSEHRMDTVCNVELYRLAYHVVLKTVFPDNFERELLKNCYANF